MSPIIDEERIKERRFSGIKIDRDTTKLCILIFLAGIVVGIFLANPVKSFLDSIMKLPVETSDNLTAKK